MGETAQAQRSEDIRGHTGHPHPLGPALARGLPIISGLENLWG